MRKRSVVTRGAVSALLALSLTAMQIPTAAIAADDYNQTVDVVAQDGTDKSLEVGNISVTNGDGAHVLAYDGTSATLTSGSITGGDSSIGVWTSAEDESSHATTTVNGNVTAGGDAAVKTDAESGGKADVTVNGNVTSDKTGDGVSVNADGATANVTVNGNVSGTWNGVSTSAQNGGSAATTVKGDISSLEFGIRTASEGKGSSANVTVIGNVTANTDYGIRQKTEEDGSSSVTVTGDVTGATGAYAAAFGDSQYLFIGDVDDFQNTNQIGAGGGTIALVIDGNLTGTSGSGLEVDVQGMGGTADVLVTGTIAGSAKNGYAGVNVADKNAANNTTLTAWQITPNGNGTVATLGHGKDSATSFESAINYIIKVLQPKLGATLTATNAKGGALAKSHGYDVAHEGDTVLLKVDLKPGYVLAGAYGNEGQTLPLTQDAKGNWYIKVPKGGGVMLSAIVKPTSNTEPASNTEPTPNEHAEPAKTSATPTKTKTAATGTTTDSAFVESTTLEKTTSVATKVLPATADKTSMLVPMLVACTSLVAFVGSVALRKKGHRA